MLREIRPAIVVLVALTLDHRPRLSAGHDRRSPGDLFPHQAAGQPDRTRRQGGRLRADRPGVQQRQIFPRPAVGDHRARSGRCDQDRAGALQRRQFRRLESRPVQQGADRPRAGRRRQAEGRESRRCRSRSIWSPPRPAASIPISRRRPRCSRCRVLPRRAICRKIAFGSWSPITPGPLARAARRAARQRAGAQSGARSAGRRIGSRALGRMTRL